MARSKFGEQQIKDEVTITHEELAAWQPENFTVSGTLTLSGLALTDNNGVLEVDGEPVGGGASTFIDLTDTPTTYSGAEGKYLIATASGINWTTTSGHQDVDTGASPEFAGVQVALDIKTDNYTLTIDDTIVLADPGSGGYSTTISPTASNDDGQVRSNSYFNSTFNTATLGRQTGIDCHVFVRCDSFDGDPLPQGALITSANLYAYIPNTTVVEATAHCADVDDAVAPTSYAGFNAISLTDGTDFSLTAAGSQNIDITDEVQEVVDRPGYASGQAIMAMLKERATPTVTNRTLFTWDYWDSNGSYKPIINIEFSTSVLTITVPSTIITDNPGRPYLISKYGASSYKVNITCEGAETINGESTISLYNQYDVAILVSDGTNVTATVVPAGLYDHSHTTFSGTSAFVDGDATVTGTMYAHVYDSYSPLTIKDGGVTVITGNGAGVIDFPAGATISGVTLQDGADGADGAPGASGTNGVDGDDAPSTFYELSDTPEAYDDGKYLRSTFVGTEWATISGGSGGGASTLLDLTDTPAAYDNGSYLRSTASGIEFSSTVATTSGYTGDIEVLVTGSGVYAAPEPTEIAFNFTTTTAVPATMSFSDGVLTTFSG